MIGHRRSFLASAVVLAASALSVSCNDDTSAPSDDTRMHIEIPNSLTLLAGTTEVVRVTVVRNDFDGVVTLRAENLPGGVIAPDVTVNPGETSADFPFTASASALPGVADAVIRAEADSVSPSIRSLRLTVKPPGSFTLSADPLGLVAGNSGSTAITLHRLGGFDGTVSLMLSAPAGLVASLNPTELSAGSSTSLLTVVADRATRPGAYFVTVRASSPGFSDEFFDVIVTVAPN